MNGRDASGGGRYKLVPANSIDDARLFKFAAAAWPGRRDHGGFLSSWWRRAEPVCGVAAVHQATNAMAGVCAARPSEWMIDGRRHPAVALCDLYIAPDHGGRLLGRRLIRHFYEQDRFVHGFSMSADAIAYVTRLGWAGPHAASLMVLPLPGVAKTMHSIFMRAGRLDLHEYVVDAGALPPALAICLDRIEDARRLASPAHMLRGAADWRWRLDVGGRRRYFFCVVHRSAEPVGYVAVRRMTPGRSRMLGRLTGAIITDLVAVGDDPAVLRALGAAAASLAARMAVTVAIAATTSASHRRALADIGYWSAELPALGRLLARRSPLFMWLPRGPATGLTADRMVLTFADSDVDFNL